MNHSSHFKRVMFSFALAGALFCTNALPVLAVDENPISATSTYAASSGFDFRAEDSIGKYDEYDKVTDTASNIEYVSVSRQNTINTTSNGLPASFYRYGAYLRSPEEVQNYMIPNYKYNGKINQNVLTIYADPEVKFEVLDSNKESVATNTGATSTGMVEYFKKSMDGSSMVYYLELKPMDVQVGKWIVKFTTTSAAQPHYSFWFGNPLTKTGTATVNSSFMTSVQAPNRASTSVSVSSPSSIPTRAWVSRVTVKRVSLYGAANINRANLNLTLSNGTQPVGDSTSNSTITFVAYPSNASAASAKGNYNFSLGSVSWKTGTRAGTIYRYEGKATIEYLYAFGA